MRHREAQKKHFSLMTFQTVPAFPPICLIKTPIPRLEFGSELRIAFGVFCDVQNHGAPRRLCRLGGQQILLSLCCHDDDTPPLPPPPSSPVLLLTLSVSLRFRSVPLPALLIGNYSFWLLPPPLRYFLADSIDIWSRGADGGTAHACLRLLECRTEPRGPLLRRRGQSIMFAL